MPIRDSLLRAVKSEAAESAESTETARNGLTRRENGMRNEPCFFGVRRSGGYSRPPERQSPRKSRLVGRGAIPTHGAVPCQFPLIPRIPRLPGAGARARKGISLLEAVVAIAIVGITAVSALEAAGGNMRAAERSRRAIEAEALATSRLDFMDLLNDRELQALPDSVEKGKFDPPLDEYSWKTTSTPFADQAGVYAIHVIIEWPSGSYTLRSYAYRTPPFATRR